MLIIFFINLMHLYWLGLPQATMRPKSVAGDTILSAPECTLQWHFHAPLLVLDHEL